MSGAEQRSKHPEGKLFEKFFTRLLLVHTGSCWERDVLRDNKEVLWASWLAKAAADGPPETCKNCDGSGKVPDGCPVVKTSRDCPACEGKGLIYVG